LKAECNGWERRPGSRLADWLQSASATGEQGSRVHLREGTSFPKLEPHGFRPRVPFAPFEESELREEKKNVDDSVDRFAGSLTAFESNHTPSRSTFKARGQNLNRPAFHACFMRADARQSHKSRRFRGFWASGCGSGQLGPLCLPTCGFRLRPLRLSGFSAADSAAEKDVEACGNVYHFDGNAAPLRCSGSR
jgi:hypothetical protein